MSLTKSVATFSLRGPTMRNRSAADADSRQGVAHRGNHGRSCFFRQLFGCLAKSLNVEVPVMDGTIGGRTWVETKPAIRGSHFTGLLVRLITHPDIATAG